MKALIVGASKGFGLSLTNELTSLGWTVNTMSRTGTIPVDWKTINQATLEKSLKLLDKQDLIFFYQNYSALNKSDYTNNLSVAELWKREKDWSQGHFVSSILPYHIIKTVGAQRVGFMLSPSSYEHGDLVVHGDYVGNKYQNYITMRNFSLTGQGCYFGLTPKQESDLDNSSVNTLNFLKNISDKELNGNVFYLDGTLVTGFNTFLR